MIPVITRINSIKLNINKISSIQSEQTAEYFYPYESLEND